MTTQLPPGIETREVHAGPFLDDEGKPFRGSVTFTSSRPRVWAATGTPILPRPLKRDLDENGECWIALPATNQDGYTDGAGNAVKDWTYTARVDLQGRGADSRTFQVPEGAGVIDLDLTTPVPSSQGVVVSLPTVLSVAGFSGAVSVDNLRDAGIGGADDPTVAGIVEAPETLTHHAVHATSSLQPAPLSGATVTALATGDIQVIGVHSGYLWGRSGTGIRRSSDQGATWSTWGTAPEALIYMIPTPDGEVVAISAGGLYRSVNWASGSPSWQTKATPNGACQFQPWSLSGNGTKFITTEYAAGSNFPDSRYARISLDGGVTWAVAYDSNALHGTSDGNASHLHGCCYDPWSDRFYISEGHGPAAGLYYSADDGATWATNPGLSNVVPVPTVIIPTDDGLVCASDSERGGLYGVVREANPAFEEFRQTWAWNPGTPGTSAFGVHGWRDPATGVVYIGFRTEKSEASAAPFIAGGTATSGAMVWTWDGEHAAYDDIRRVVVVAPGVLHATASIQGVVHYVRGRIPRPGVRDATLYDTGKLLGGRSGANNSTAVGPRSTSGTGQRNVAVGTGADASAVQDATALGVGSTATSTSATAVGAGASVTIGNGTALGEGATVTGASGTAIGRRASVTGGSAVAIGSMVVAPTSSTVIGGGASVLAGSQATVIGAGAGARNSGVAVGHSTSMSGNNSTVVGQGAAAGSNGVALGQGATALGSDAIALGRATATTSTWQVNFGPRHVELQAPANAPLAPAEGAARLFTRVVEGKTEVCVRFPTGAVQVISTEP